MTNIIRTIVATDCGSTTTKAILIEREGDEYRLVARSEAPTTVEAPFDDVTVGVLNAVSELEDLTGRTFTRDGHLVVPRENDRVGMDLFLSTSSAGGGLQMLVAGVVKSMTAESAQRAALGAGAIVIDVLAVDDGRKDYQRVERIRGIRPDMILLSGGTDGGTTQHLLDLAETLRAADPKPRLGKNYRLPVVYAGNVDAREAVQQILGEQRGPGIRGQSAPGTGAREPAARARRHARTLPAPRDGAGARLRQAADVGEFARDVHPARGRRDGAGGGRSSEGTSVLAVDIGGATTDVFSVFRGVFNRTVSANLGMSYSVCNVLAEATTAEHQALGAGDDERFHAAQSPAQ